ncbi:MAG: hypothetical protein BMS9Abin02_2043 [Anaerolineae bacterium]|nr:MAG: hypothetical protein BMS9Abin02_2043 [Anaerolineae bacterium]
MKIESTKLWHNKEPVEEAGIEEEPELISFGSIIAPTLESQSIDCRGSDGGWDASS